MKIEFPDDTPDFVKETVTTICERADQTLRGMTQAGAPPDYARGYCAAAMDMVEAMETEAAIAKGDREEKIREARERDGQSTQ
jgi:hypothetical protein